MQAHCPICSESHVVYTDNHLDFHGVHIYFCANCMHWFAHPEPDSALLDRYYLETYSQQRRRYFGEPYYVLMQRRAAAQVMFIKRHIGNRNTQCVPLRGWKVLDMGCGVGALIAALQREGADAIGYDSDPIAIEVGQSRWQANVHVSTSNELDSLRGSFDLLCMSHLVEHLPDIKDSLSNIMQVVRPGGWVFIEVPNCFAEMFKSNVDTESHLHFFTRKSLIWLLQSIDLQVTACESCGPAKFPAYDLYDTSSDGKKLQDSALRFQKAMQKLQDRVKRILQPSSAIKTIYDGYYDKYYPSEDGGGMWLRCLARKKR